VGLAQALSCRADLLVLDEPWSGLDASAAAALDARLEAQSARGAGMLLADHTGRAGALPVERADALLAAALSAGCSVLGARCSVLGARCSACGL
jgi:ABC-type transport system involved in cytochrome c biogenesis ATPase subunit